MADDETQQKQVRIDQNVQKTVAIAALHKIRGYVNQATEEERLERKALWISAGVVAVVLVSMVGYMAYGAFRSSVKHEAQALAAKPRVVHAGAVGQEASLALFVDKVVRQIEKSGNENYPRLLSNQGIYGSVLVLIQVKPDGSLHDVTTARSSGIKELDREALALVRKAAPFEQFPEDLRSRTDVVAIAKVMHFAKVADTGTGKEAGNLSMQ